MLDAYIGVVQPLSPSYSEAKLLRDGRTIAVDGAARGGWDAYPNLG